MKNRIIFFQNQEGFSLVEIIITITIASALFAMMFAYFNTSVYESSQPVTQLNRTFNLTRTAERITEHYRQDTSADLKIIKDNLAKKPGRYGKGYSVVTSEFVKFVKGNDTPAKKKDPKNVLKIQIRQDDTNETITLLFTKQ